MAKERGRKKMAGSAPAYLPPQALARALRALSGHPAIITTHSLADSDAAASCLALAEFLGSKAVVALPDRANSESRRLFATEMGAGAQAMPFETARAKYPKAPIILLDANDRSILPQFGGGEKVSLLVDHHALSRHSVRAKIEWVEPDASSACELVASLIARPSPEAARWLILGILSDSAHLLRANARTFGTLARLLEHTDEDYEQLLNSLRQPQNAQSRAAVLEGLRQATWKLDGEWLLASAAVSSHESHVADALINAGADAAFAGTADKKGARISARLRPSLADRLDLPLLMREVGRFLGGDGGGHPAAAGASGPDGAKLDEAMALALRLCSESLAKV